MCYTNELDQWLQSIFGVIYGITVDKQNIKVYFVVKKLKRTHAMFGLKIM